MITTLVLDADGVLINGESFAKVLARDYDIDKTKEKEFFTTHFQDCLIGKTDLKESIAPYLPSFGWQGTVDEFLEYWFKAEHSLDEELVAYIQKLRKSGIRAILATNQERYRTDYMLEHMGFDSAFDGVYSSARLGSRKPDVEFYVKLLEDLDAAKDEVLFWDNDQRNVDGAAKCGLHAELYDDFASFLVTMSEKYGLAL